MTITNDFVTLDSCDDTAPWAASADATLPSLDTVVKKEGAASINMGKTGTASNVFYYERTFQAINVERKVLAVWVYASNLDAIAKITAARVYIFDSAGNWAYWDFLNFLKMGWNSWRALLSRYRTDYTADGTSATKPAYNDIVKIRIYFETSLATDTIAQGNLKMDYWRYGYYITIDNGTFAFSDIYDYDVSNALGCIFKDEWSRAFYLGCGIQVGLGTNTTLLYAEKQQIIFLPKTLWYWGAGAKGGIYVKTNGELRLGRIRNETLKTVWMGCSVYNQSPKVYEIMLDGEGGGNINLYGCSIGSVEYCTGVRAANRVWGCYFNHDARLDAREGSDVYMVEMMGYYSNLAPKGSVDMLLATTLSYYAALTYVALTSDKTAKHVTLRNCVRDTYCYGWAQGVRLFLIDLDVDHDPLLTRWYSSGYMTGERIWQQYRIPFRIVDKNGNPVQGVTIEIYDKNGNLESSGTTDVNGEWTSAPCTYKTYGMQEGATGSTDLTDIWEYSPHTIVIKKPGWQTHKFKANLKELWSTGSVRVVHRAVGVFTSLGDAVINLKKSDPENKNVILL